jgi:hypothetical protein
VPLIGIFGNDMRQGGRVLLGMASLVFRLMLRRHSLRGTSGAGDRHVQSIGVFGNDMWLRAKVMLGMASLVIRRGQGRQRLGGNRGA